MSTLQKTELQALGVQLKTAVVDLFINVFHWFLSIFGLIIWIKRLIPDNEDKVPSIGKMNSRCFIRRKYLRTLIEVRLKPEWSGRGI